MKALTKFLTDEQATETVEWAILIGLIAVASIVTIIAIGNWVTDKFVKLEAGLASSNP
ncbi:MAG: Flp family type IVb pilin [Planctomycetota bacterium]|jgi:pilus assembly protein Flp/PilA